MKYILWSKWSKARNQQKTNGSGPPPRPRGICFRIARKSDKQQIYAGKASWNPVNTGIVCPRGRILIFRDTPKLSMYRRYMETRNKITQAAR